MIPMQQISEIEKLNIAFSVGDENSLDQLINAPAKKPFDREICAFLEELSVYLMRDKEAKIYSDVVSFAFWIRRSNVTKLQERFEQQKSGIVLGRGTAFHIAPSNVPVNFAYSMAAGLLCGNKNIVRLPGRDFTQVDIITAAINEILKDYPDILDYIALVRYGHDRACNDFFSSIADVRIIWGGDETISEIRKSPLPARSTEVLFADRFSLSLINADEYLAMDEKRRVAESFYNDTYYSDQNACTSPILVVWTGEKKAEAKELFWNGLYEVVKDKYGFEDIQFVNKLTGVFLASTKLPGIKQTPMPDLRIVRIQLDTVDRSMIECRQNSGFFFEYDCEDIMELRELCDDDRCQTIGVLGDKEELLPLIESGVRGIDRITDMGKTMDFDLIWDGYDLYSRLTRIVSIK